MYNTNTTADITAAAVDKMNVNYSNGNSSTMRWGLGRCQWSAVCFFMAELSQSDRIKMASNILKKRVNAVAP